MSESQIEFIRYMECQMTLFDIWLEKINSESGGTLLDIFSKDELMGVWVIRHAKETSDEYKKEKKNGRSYIQRGLN
jgi:hypothetical protein